MNKKLIRILVVLSILALSVTSAFSSPTVTQVKLLSVNYMNEKGVTFKFLVDGNFRKSKLQGNVTVNGKSIKLYCNYGGDSTPVVVVCTAYKGTAKFAGHVGVVTVAGRSFRFVIPARTIF